MTAPIVIVGAGLAGLRTAEELRRAGYDGELVLVGDEARLPYDRPPLSKQFVRGETDDTTLRPSEFYAEKRIDVRLSTEAVGVDTDARRVRLADGSTLDYDQLVIATGLRPRRLPGLPELRGVHVLRGHADAVALRADLADTATALVIGAGFIGCELAASFRANGVGVVLVEPQATPLASVLGTQVGELIARMHRAEGVDLRCGTGLDTLHGDDAGRVRGARLSDGSEIAADLVAIGVGSRPVTEWLSDSGIALAEPSAGGGVLADEVGRTSAAGVWAVGDVAAWLHETGSRKRVEHWTNAGEQAKLLACALLGAAAPTAARVPYFWSDQYDVKIQALGTPTATDDVHIVSDDGRKFLAYYAQAGTLTGVVGAGMTAQVMKVRAKIAAGASMTELLAPS
ncbi:NAD(P)/FAD-dependent oxidoreductase [Nocardia pneumoniae]|uniref:NAD(P)/FAD-dependent oxidoreductase n=1 Tax=Nocardia pneumoniae TaxID=228601 RepID=UPI000301E316|nr:FAD/NAD(P)-binding oxidoreductase [Nocardia pneumoniae]